MTWFSFLSTVLGGFILPFLIILIWGPLVNRFGAKGGWLAAFLIIGPVWLLNHGLKQSLIVQQSSVFVDMGLATAVGVFVYNSITQGQIKASLFYVFAAVLGGLLAGILLYAFI